MAVSKDTFPFAPLGERHMKLISAALGLRSPEDTPLLEGFRYFLGVNRETALPEPWYRHYLAMTSRQCLGALGMMEAQATLASNRGALLYAGAVTEAGGFRPLPRDSEVLSEKRDLNTRDLALAAIQAADSIPSFSGLLETVRPLLGEEADYDGLDAARVGAGLLHVITTESIAVAERDGTPLSKPGLTPTVAAGIKMDAGLRDLVDIFRDAPWPKRQE